MQIKDIAHSYVFALIIAMSVFFIKYLSLSCWLILLVQISVGIIIFSGGIYFFKFDEFEDVKEVFMSIWKRKIMA